MDFNPRTHKECDKFLKSRLQAYLKFQSTHSQGVRPQIIIHNNDKLKISIHALTRSATQKMSDSYIEIVISIHALTRSAT